MCAAATFEELKSNRKELVEVMKKNNNFNGFMNLLTELYPDKAHFIYELLQNAEDMNATEVKFRLYDDKLIFIHNGNKRGFPLEDVDRITNIANSGKKDEPTEIGKFGVGFKSVYAYTSTPEIYSREYCFKIVDMLIPEDSGINDCMQDGMTKFVFPFDNAAKPAETAVYEIAEGLCGLDETAVLFLNHIKKIDYELQDGSNGYVRIDDGVHSERFIVGIHVKKASESTESGSYWSKFSRKCRRQISNKQLNIAVAYRMKQDDQSGSFSVDSDLTGRVSIFFPTDQKSGLHFHINAPFASTVARDNIKDCDDNNSLIEELADLSVEALYDFKEAKLLNYDVYDALPTKRDSDIGPRYKIFAEKIEKAFDSGDLLVTESGEYLCKENVMYVEHADESWKHILPSGEVEKYYQKSWLKEFKNHERTKRFIEQLKIVKFNISKIIDTLRENPNCFKELFASQNTEYFEELYRLFSTAKMPYNGYFDEKIKETLQKVEFIKCEDGTLHKPTDEIYFKTEYQPKHVQDPVYVDFPMGSGDWSDPLSGARSCLLRLGVREMNKKNDLVAASRRDGTDDSEMIEIMNNIIREYRSGQINMYEDEPVFVTTDSGEKHQRKACECCWDEHSKFFYPDDYSLLNTELYRAYDIPMDVLKDIFVKLGGKAELKIKRLEDGEVLNKLKYARLLSKIGIDESGNQYGTTTVETYTLDGFYWERLGQIKEKKLVEEARMLWQLVVKCNDKRYLYTKYRANKQAKEQKKESFLVYYLKNTEWVPAKGGEYKRPGELTQEEWLDGFEPSSSALSDEICGKPVVDEDELYSRLGLEGELINIVKSCKGMSSEKLEQLNHVVKMFLNAETKKPKQRTRKSSSEAVEDPYRKPMSQDGYGDDVDVDYFDEDDGYDYYFDEDDGDDYDEDEYDDDESDNSYNSHGTKNTDKLTLEFEKMFESEQPAVVKSYKLRHSMVKPDPGEKVYVKNEYGAHCQICRSEGILTKNRKRYFVAINIFDTGKHSDDFKKNLNIGWNTLSLCPNCAAKFKHSNNNIQNEVIKFAESMDFDELQDDWFEIPVQIMDGLQADKEKRQAIIFTRSHLTRFACALKVLKKRESEGNSEGTEN